VGPRIRHPPESHQRRHLLLEDVARFLGRQVYQTLVGLVGLLPAAARGLGVHQEPEEIP
jgi:hypothetical protein